jgi:hypothetical protein
MSPEIRRARPTGLATSVASVIPSPSMLERQALPPGRLKTVIAPKAEAAATSAAAQLFGSIIQDVPGCFRLSFGTMVHFSPASLIVATTTTGSRFIPSGLSPESSALDGRSSRRPVTTTDLSSNGLRPSTVCNPLYWL